MKKNEKKAQKAANQAAHLTSANSLGPRAPKSAKKDKVGKAKARPKMQTVKLQTVRGGQAWSPSAQADVIHASASRWAYGLEHPFNGSPQKCPWNFNPVPSYLTFCATTSAAVLGVVQANAGTTNQLTFWPGHGVLANYSALDATATNQYVSFDFDEVAYHYPFQLVGGGQVPCHGPCNFVDSAGNSHAPMAFCDNNGLALGSVTAVSTASVYRPWNATIPVVGDIRASGHLRCKMTAMGIRIRNITPELTRGGSIISVQPATVGTLPATQAGLTIHPSWFDWGTESAEITWIPRLRDLAYWHPATAIIAASGAPVTTADMTSAGILVFCNAPAGAAQTYDVEVVAHWEISGYSVQTLADVAKSTNLSDSVLKSALSSQTNNSPTASGFSRVLPAAAGLARAVGRMVGSAAPRVAAGSAAVASAISSLA